MTYPSQGSFSWEAVYSGDANNSAATSACEPLLVSPARPTITTNLTVSPNISGLFQVSSPGTQACGIAFNPSDDHVYATSFGTSTVLDIPDATNVTAATLAVGPGPCAIAYDSHNHDM